MGDVPGANATSTEGTEGSQSEATAAEEAQRITADDEAQLAAEKREKGNGTIRVKAPVLPLLCLEYPHPALPVQYEIYDESFMIVDGTLLAADVDARLCLSFVMPGCAPHPDPDPEP